MKRGHHVVGHDRGLGTGLESGGTPAERGQQAAPDHDVVGALAERDADHLHWTALRSGTVHFDLIGRRRAGPNGHSHGALLQPD